MNAKNNTIKPSIETFKDRDKEAAFWEENFDTAAKIGKPIKVHFAKNLSETINIRLDTNSLHTIRIQALERGLGPTQLIRMWVMEKINSSSHLSKTA